MKIMIVEDNADLRDIYEGLFLGAGYEVKLAGDGLMGITDAVDFQPDIVLLDIMMPEMDGYDFLRVLRDNTSITPFVVVCSNITQQMDIDRALAGGAHHYLRKSDYVGASLVNEVARLYDEYRQAHAA